LKHGFCYYTKAGVFGKPTKGQKPERRKHQVPGDKDFVPTIDTAIEGIDLKQQAGE
jgi:hypothetical protein